MEPDESRSSKPERAALVAVATNLVLTAVKFALAAFTASLALLAEAFHSLADIGSSVAVFLALRAERVGSQDRGSRLARLLGRHPQRTVAILIGVFLIGVAVSVLRKVLEPNEIAVEYPVPAGMIMLVLAFFSLLLSRFERAVGERAGSTALLADGLHSRVDMFGSLLVAIALLGEAISLRVDQLAAGVIAFFIFVQAINVFVTVVRDSLRDEEGADYLYPDWLVRAVERSVDRVKTRLTAAWRAGSGSAAKCERGCKGRPGPLCRGPAGRLPGLSRHRALHGAGPRGRDHRALRAPTAGRGLAGGRPALQVAVAG
jgi:cation diffusion facilitator family transporter